MGPACAPTVRHWAVGIVTAPRPQPTLLRTLESLRRAGWPSWHVVDDTPKQGSAGNWLRTLRTIVAAHPDADAYLMLEDDAVFCQHLRAYLETVLWPEDPQRIALCSPYSPEAYCRPTRGWHLENRGLYLVASTVWVLPPGSARAVLEDLGQSNPPRWGTDRTIGHWAGQKGLNVWYHSPSLAQHTGVGNSALGDPLVSPLRLASDFIGEEATPWA